MSKLFEVLRIVVASPGDVQNERDSLDKVLAELNQGIAADRNLRLELARWETDSYPGFHVDGPQGLIDTVLRIQDCDLLIGIFWKRFGTPTVDAESGTVHELREGYQAWKMQGKPHIMVYFNEKPYSPATSAETEQWGRVLDFKKNFSKDGLWWAYRGPKQFTDLVRAHLTQFLRHRSSISSQGGGNAAAPAEQNNLLDNVLPGPTPRTSFPAFAEIHGDTSRSETVQEVILLLHGIRTQAEWQTMVAHVLESPSTTVTPIKYGFFDAFRFWLPFLTRNRANAEIEWKIREAQRRNPEARLSVIAHSFGCYAIGSILKEHPDIRLHRLLLCGSVLPRDFRWDQVAHRVDNDIINECGTRDIWPILAQSSSWGYGASGTFGFGTPGVLDRFHGFGHSGFFRQEFVSEFWLTWFKSGKCLAGDEARTRPYFWSLLTVLQIKWALLLLLFIGTLFAILKRSPLPTSETSTIQRMELYVRRHHTDPPRPYLLVADGQEETAPPIDPLGAADDFKIVARFDRPTYWYLLWFDTWGNGTVQARAAEPEMELRYPSGSDYLSVEQADPPGLHMLMVLSGPRSSSVAELLQKRFDAVGKPPEALPARWSLVLQGGGTVHPGAEVPLAYVDRIRSQLPSEVRPLHLFFLLTEKK